MALLSPASECPCRYRNGEDRLHDLESKVSPGYQISRRRRKIYRGHKGRHMLYSQQW